MTENKSPKDHLLDLVVFVPAGLAITVVEELPRLAEKGRHRIEGQVNTARVIGQFAVQIGRSELSKRFRPDRVPADEPEAGVDRPDDRDRPAPVPAQPRPTRPAAGVEDDGGPGPGDRVSENGQGPPVSSLAIPGYDTLSASQVVQRLGGLSLDELGDVRDHELAHRHRRTILNRVEQLLAASTASEARPGS